MDQHGLTWSQKNIKRVPKAAKMLPKAATLHLFLLQEVGQNTIKIAHQNTFSEKVGSGTPAATRGTQA